MRLGKRWSNSEDKILRRVYLEERKTIEETAKILERTPASIFNRASKLRITKKPSKFKFPSLSPELARVHAHVCGDGFFTVSREINRGGFYRRWGYDKGSHVIRHVVGYSNKNKLLINEFVRDVKKCFGIKPSIIKRRIDGTYEARLRSKRVCDFLKNLGAGDSYSWSISKIFLEGPQNVKKRWIEAFFDDEAHFSKDGRIRVKSVNRPGLGQVKLLLEEFVPCHITPQKKSYGDGTYYLNVLKSNQKRFILSFRSKKTAKWLRSSAARAIAS